MDLVFDEDQQVGRGGPFLFPVLHGQVHVDVRPALPLQDALPGNQAGRDVEIAAHQPFHEAGPLSVLFRRVRAEEQQPVPGRVPLGLAVLG